jgi:hypothetical protein
MSNIQPISQPSQPKCISRDETTDLAKCVSPWCHNLLCQKHAAEDAGRCAKCSFKGKVTAGLPYTEVSHGPLANQSVKPI